jgi:putative hemolysin
MIFILLIFRDKNTDTLFYGLEITHSSNHFDVITNYENSFDITRTRVRRGHEEESFLSLFPKGFITYMGKRIPLS